MSTRNMIWLGAMAAMLTGCTGQEPTGAAGGATTNPTLFGLNGGCGGPSGCGTGNGTGVYYEEGGNAGIDSIHLMITRFINNGSSVSFQGRYQDTTTGLWYFLPSPGHVVGAYYNGFKYQVVSISDYPGYPTYPSVTLFDAVGGGQFTVYGYNFPSLKLEIAISRPIAGQWELSFGPSTWGSDNYAQSTTATQSFKPFIYKWDMYWQNTKLLDAPPAPYCQRALQTDVQGNISQPDDYVVFQKGIQVDPVTGSVAYTTANDVTLSCRYGAIATAYLWGYSYINDPWHYSSAIHMKRASYCGDASYYTVSGTQIDIQDEVPIEGAPIENSKIEAFWGPSGALCYNGPRRPDLLSFGIKPFSGSCGGVQIPLCSTSTQPPYSSVPSAMSWANSQHTHALVDGTTM